MTLEHPDGRKEARFPELKGMIVRDLRKAANTAMRAGGTDPATAARLLGHSSEMNYRYVEATDAAAQQAILSLTVTKSTTGVNHQPEEEPMSFPAASA